jgi:hypothetical protein
MDSSQLGINRPGIATTSLLLHKKVFEMFVKKIKRILDYTVKNRVFRTPLLQSQGVSMRDISSASKYREVLREKRTSESKPTENERKNQHRMYELSTKFLQ